ncbi:GDSL esterase/lipase-like protein [Cinnamomum micranthum f. kanehirae]|uniref:GDSL esterase/lipase-like protein n=1 Tax=Cinnamomum micranthum f. kanehirae TaxID=337451 RepID=A0A443PZR7_9MAGN|nr:GDSL esterase/lipase-like protein [Cinnamomum micranthum f. kanehirae]
MANVLSQMWAMGVLFLVLNLLHGVRPDPQVPCYFIFGDSLVDNGNNNAMASNARANYFPYGIDFPDGPTGRFCNGRTAVDILAQLLGFDNFIPPYSTTKGQDILTGVNFASAAAGIREETGYQLGGRITMNGQVRNFQAAVEQIVNILGDEKSAANHLSQCIYTVVMGGNDYLNNYFMPLFYSSGRQYTPVQFADLLIQEYSQQLRSLYDLGARKVAVIGVGQVGCIPSELAAYSSNGVTCVDGINNAVQIFNSKVVSLIDDFNKNLDGANFTFLNGFYINEDILQRASSYGFTVANTGCCGVGRNNGQYTCLPFQTPCENRDKYVFWDAYHPTEAFNLIFARRSYIAESPSDAYPVDIRRLAQL